jgi:hypothetical protein
VRASGEIVVERQLGCIGRADCRRLSEPQPVLDAADSHDSVPPITRLAKFAGRKINGKEPGRLILRRRFYPLYRNDRGQRFRRPKDRLLVKTPFRVMSESRRTTPS